MDAPTPTPHRFGGTGSRRARADAGPGGGIGVREEDSRLRRRLDDVISAMKQDGPLNALIKRWFSPGAPRSEDAIPDRHKICHAYHAKMGA